MRVNKLESQVEVLTDLIAENKKLREKVGQLKHLRRMDLEFLGILVWGYGIDKHKYNSMDKRIYSGYSTYLQRTYDWDWLTGYVADERDISPLFDRIELIDNEVRRDKEEEWKKLEKSVRKREEEQKKKEEEEKIVLNLTPEIIEKAKKGELDETE
jgi:hypothetical protein